MANFLNYIVESSIQPVKTNVLWIKNGVPYYFNKKWKPLLGSGSGGGSGESVDSPIQFGEGEYSAVLKNSNSKALNEYALALGYNTVSNNPSETAFGRYNKSIQSNVLSEATLFSIGNGTKDKFNNALEVKYDGSLFLQNLDKSVQENLKVLLENQISFDVDLKEISASINATGEQLRSEYTQIREDLEGNINDLSSSITQTAEEIRLEVNEVQTNLDGKIEENASLIQQTAEQIRLEVSEEVKTLDGKIEENTSSITQTASEIRSEVSKSIETLDGKINENSTSISQTAESITVLASKTEELENKNVEYDSKFVQTAEQIEAVVGRVETTEESIKDVNSSITQTAEQIRLEVNQSVQNLDGKIAENTSSITQTAEQIRSEVNKSIEEVNGSISDVSSSLTQTAESIRSEVAKEVETLSGEIEKNTTSITQNANSINLRVEGLEGTLNSKTSELEGKITKNTSEIALNKEQIGLKVNTDVFDELAGTVEQQGASIEINTNSIKNKVEQSNFNAFTGEVTNQFTEVNQSIEGITTTIQSNTGKITVIEATVDGLTSKTGTLEAEIDSLKKQSDGSIDTHFGTTAPTLNNEPAINWDTDELKNEHTGDIYYNNNTGEAYRFSYDPQTNTYFWVELTDSALTDALEKISKLEEAIDGKVTIFYTQPSNYKYGDIWFVHNSSYSSYKEGSLLTATNLDKDAVVESFNLNHWVLKADIVKSLNDLDKTITDAFKDNIITIAEVDAIKESKKSFEASFQELTSAHAIIIATTLGNSTKLKTAYSNLENKYNVFIQSINSLVLDSNGNLSDILLQAYTTAYNDYVEALKNYSKAKEELTDSIQKELSSANDYIKDISSDGVITPIEKKNLIEIWRSIAEEFNTNKGIAVNYKIIDSEGNERTDIYSDGVYYSNYALYEAAFDEIKTIFTSDIFGISNTTTSTTLPEGYSIDTIDNTLNNYYDTLSVFAEMISKITIEITDAHEKVLQLSKELQEQLSPSDNITQIGKGVILSSIIGVQSNGVLQAGLNATNINGLVDTSKDNHGRIVFAGGINGATDWNTANTVIYEDGYVHFRWGEIDEGVEIGNALIRSVVSGTIDLFSYPENGTLVPLFIVNKDNTGKIVSISTPYDFIANKNLIVHGDTSSGGEGGEAAIGVTGIIVDGKQFIDKNSDGYIDLSEAFVGLSPTITSTMITEALGYTPLSTSGGTISGGLTIGDASNTSWLPISFNRNGVQGFIGSAGSVMEMGTNDGYLRVGGNVLTYMTSAGGNILIHSGNIGEYKAGDSDKLGGYSASDYAVRRSYPSTSDTNWSIPSGFYPTGGVTEGLPLSGVGHHVIHCNWDGNAANQLFLAYDRDLLSFRRKHGNVWQDWKTIAFTDSTVAAANKLVDASGNDAVTIGENGLELHSGFIGYKDGDTLRYFGVQGSQKKLRFYDSTEWKDVAFINSNVASAQALKHNNGTVGATVDAYGGICLSQRGLWSADGGLGLFDFDGTHLNIGYSMRNSYMTDIYGSSIRMCNQYSSPMFLVNSSGNVTIGGSDLASVGYKLFVDGILGIGGSGNSQWVTRFVSNSEIGLDIQLGRNANNDKLPFSIAWRNDLGTPPFTINPSGNVLIGTTTDDKSGAVLQVRGGISTTGQIISAHSLVFNGYYGIWKGDVFGGSGNTANSVVIYGDGINLRGATTINGDVRINGNLIITGDTASGGGSGESAIGITGILLNGTTYRDENGDGIIDLGTITSGLTSVNWSDVQGRPTSLSQFNNDLGLGSLAYKNGLTASDVGALSASGGIIYSNDVAPLTLSSFSDQSRLEFYIADQPRAIVGWRAEHGAWLFNYNGGGNYIGVKDDGTPHYNGNTLYHTGNFTSSVITTALGYTPLSTSGGTINGDLNINGYLTTDKTRIRLGAYYIFVSSDAWKVSDASWQHDYTLIHSGNYSDLIGNTYLKTSGGKINGIFEIHNTAGAYNSVIEFSNTSSYLGALGVSSYNRPVFYNGAAYEDILTTSGGTISGTNDAPLKINTTFNTSSIFFQKNDTNKAQVGWDNGLGAFLGNSVMGYALCVRDEGTPSFYNGAYNTLIHSGNIGDYALKLDGSNITPTTINANNNLDDYRYGYVTYKDSKNPTNSYGDNAVVMALAGAKYNVTFQLAFDGNNDRLGYRRKSIQDTWSDWKTIAFTDSTVDKAKSVVDASGNALTLIHSGNVGEYAPLRKSRHNTIDLNTAANGFYEVGYSGQEISNRPSGTNNGLFMDFRDANGYAKIQFYGNNTTNGLYFRTEQGASSSIGSAWKKIAFTDSNVAGAKTLVNDAGDTILIASNSNRLSDWQNLQLYESGSTGVSAYPYYQVFGSPSNSVATVLQGGALAAIKVNGVERFWVNSSGNVTIGNTDKAGANDKLYVDGHMVASWLYFKEADGTYSSYVGRGSSNSDIYLYSKATLKMYAGSSAAMIINSSGNVTIGSQDLLGDTTLAKFYVDGGMGAQRDLGGNIGDYINLQHYAQFEISRKSNTMCVSIAVTDDDYGIIQSKGMGITSTGQLAINPNGGNVYIGAQSWGSFNPTMTVSDKVLIGTTTDNGAKLQVKGNIDLDYYQLRFTGNSDNFQFGMGADNMFIYQNWYGHYFTTNGAERMRITSGGNVGIGTTDPQYKLDVAGDARVRGAVTMSSTLSVGGDITLTGALTRSFQYAVDADRAGNLYFKTNVTSWKFYNSAGSEIILVNGSNEFVGIGTNNPQFKLHVNGTAKINDIVRLGANLYVSQDSTAYGLQLWGDADGGYLGVHAKGSFKSTNMRFGYDGSATVYGNLVVQGDISA